MLNPVLFPLQGGVIATCSSSFYTPTNCKSALKGMVSLAVALYWLFFCSSCCILKNPVQLYLCLHLQPDLRWLPLHRPGCQHQVVWWHHHLPLCSFCLDIICKVFHKTPICSYGFLHYSCSNPSQRSTTTPVSDSLLFFFFSPLFFWLFWCLRGNVHWGKGHWKNIENIHLLFKGRAIPEMKNNLEKYILKNEVQILKLSLCWCFSRENSC